jgi:DNA polymerase-1
VHDELVFDVPQDEINLIMDIVPHEMTQVIRLNIPLEVDIHYGKNWHEAH